MTDVCPLKWKYQTLEACSKTDLKNEQQSNKELF